MSILDSLKQRIDRDREKLLLLRLPAEHVDDDGDYQPLQAGAHYVRLWLEEMFLRKEVALAQRWYPAVHSLVRLQFGSQTVEIPNVADGSRVGLQQNQRGGVVARRYDLTTLLPFNGGVFEVEAGLVGVEGENFLNNFIKTLGEFAALLAVPQLSTALSVAQPLANGLQSLLGQGTLHLGAHTALAAGDEGGYIAVIRASERQVDPAGLRVVDGQLRTGNGAGDGEPFEAFDHMLFRLQLVQERGDWRMLSSIREPFDRSIEELGQLNEEQARAHLRAALVAAHQAPELTSADRRRVTAAIREDFAEAQGDLGFSGLVDADAHSFENAMRRAMPIETALQLGPPTLEELLVA